MGKHNGTKLQTAFCLWYIKREKGSHVDISDKDLQNLAVAPNNRDSKDNVAIYTYENSIKHVAMIKSVEDFWSVYDYLVRPDDLPTTIDYHFFREGIKPTWEDHNNSYGGKWIVRLGKGLASRYWEEIIFALIGCQFTGIPDGEVCGAVVSVRYSEDIISVWNRTASDRDVTERIRDAIKRILQLPSCAYLEYKPHETSLQDKSYFRNTQVWKPKINLEKDSSTNSLSSYLRRSGSWGERDELRDSKIRKETQRSWR